VQLLILLLLQVPPLVAPDRHTDSLIRQLYNNDLVTDKDKLFDLIGKIWKHFPPLDKYSRANNTRLASQLVPFITMRVAGFEDREIQIGKYPGRPIYSMLLHIGQPSIPSLLMELTREASSQQLREHREIVARCIVEIYDVGGEGKRMASQRIRLFADQRPEQQRKIVLEVLDLDSFKGP
jgi:hypothetical protein